MKVSGFTFIKNAAILNFPVVESIRSVLPICDEFVVNVGASEDNTLEIIKDIGDPKVRVIETPWNDGMRVRGFVYGQQKTIAHYSSTGDWAFYLEGDEVVHEDDLPKIYGAMERNLDNPEVEAFVFDYLHFYHDQRTRLVSPGWYRRAPRIIRNTIRAYSPDGLFFVVLDRSNKNGRYPRAAHSGARIFHYGWLRSEEQMSRKSALVNKYWDKSPEKIEYGNIDPTVLVTYDGPHPAVMNGWFNENPAPLKLNPDYKLTKRDKRRRLKALTERLLGIDLSKKHFKLVRGR